MEQNYKHIDWSKYPKRVTDLGDMNNNKLDIAIDDVSIGLPNCFILLE